MIDGEEKIVESAVRGEASAFGALYDHYQPKIFRYVVVQVRRREEAEDLTHQVFLHAWVNIHKYRNLGFPFSSWLYRIARNQVVDHFRTQKQHFAIEDLSPADEPHDTGVEPGIMLKLDTEKVQTALRSLKPQYRDVILMRFVEELTTRETAAAIGKSEGAIKLIQHRALKELKKILDPQGQTLILDES